MRFARKEYLMSFTIEDVDVKKGENVVGQASIHVFSGDQEGLRDAISFYGDGEDGIAKVVGLLNSAHRVAEQGKVRSGTDPSKAARNAIQKLSAEKRKELLDELMANA
jgi:hypothetical protein